MENNDSAWTTELMSKMMLHYKTKKCKDFLEGKCPLNDNRCFQCHTRNDEEILRIPPGQDNRGRWIPCMKKCLTGYNMIKNCRNQHGGGCTNWHYIQEIQYHPKKYKMSECTDDEFKETGRCSRGPLCWGYHDESDRRTWDLQYISWSNVRENTPPPKIFMQIKDDELKRKNRKNKNRKNKSNKSNKSINNVSNTNIHVQNIYIQNGVQNNDNNKNKPNNNNYNNSNYNDSNYNNNNIKNNYNDNYNNNNKPINMNSIHNIHNMDNGDDMDDHKNSIHNNDINNNISNNISNSISNNNVNNINNNNDNNDGSNIVKWGYDEITGFLNTFKMNKCPFGMKCKDKYCVYYHDLNDKRRDWKTYKHNPCKYMYNFDTNEYKDNNKFQCEIEKKDGQCHYTHNEWELKWHPYIFKQIECPYKKMRTDNPQHNWPWNVCLWINDYANYYHVKTKQNDNNLDDNSHFKISQFDVIDCIKKINKKNIVKYKKGTKYSDYKSGWDTCPYYHSINEKFNIDDILIQSQHYLPPK